MKNGKSSYLFDSFDNKQTELEILKRQATVAVDLERSLWTGSGLKKNMRVLDLACGPGIITCALAGFVYPGIVTGMDLSEELIAEADKYKTENRTDNVFFKCGNVYDLSFPENSFDFVYARFLFQHLKNPVRVLKNILRVLSAGGILCAVDIDDRWFGMFPQPKSVNFLIQKSVKFQKSQGGDRHIGCKLGAYLHEAGFRSVSTKIQTLTTSDIGVKKFLDISLGFRSERLPDQQRGTSRGELNEIYSLVNLPFMWGAMGIFVVKGEK